MFDIIRKLQNKPPHTRKRITFGVAASITAIIAVVWVSTFFTGERSVEDTSAIASQNAGNKAQAASPLVAIKNNIRRTYDNIKTQVRAQFSQQSTSTAAEPANVRQENRDEPKVRIIRNTSGSSSSTSQVGSSSSSDATTTDISR